jgi:hypothetical protein
LIRNDTARETQMYFVVHTHTHTSYLDIKVFGGSAQAPCETERFPWIQRIVTRLLGPKTQVPRQLV